MKRVGSPELNRVLVTAKPLPEENIIAFLLRLTELNGYDKLAWILSLAESSVGLYSSSPLFFDRGQDLSMLMKLTGISEAQLRSLQYPIAETSRQTSGYRFFGHAISRTSLCVRRPKVCPACLSQSGFISKLWDLSAYTACGTHNSLLIDRCPQCEALISWIRNRLGFCNRCGRDWTKTPCPSLDAEKVKVTQHIYRLCSNQKGRGEIGVTRSGNPLKSLKLEHLLTALYFTARQTMRPGGTTNGGFSPGNSVMHGVLADAWDVFEDWPNNFWIFLDSQRANGGRKSTVSVSSQFGPLYKNFLESFFDPCFDFIKVAFDDYLRSRWEGKYYPDRHQAFRQRLDTTYVSEHSAARRFGLTKDRLRRLIKYGKITAIKRRSRCGTFFHIQLSSLKSYKQQLDDSLSTSDLQSELGISSVGVEALIKQSYLKPITGPTVDGGSSWRIKREDVLDLVARIQANIDFAPQERRRQIIGIDDALRLCSRLGINLAQFLQLILDKQIVPCGVTTSAGMSLSTLQFDKQAVRAYVRCQMELRKQDALFLKEAAMELGIVEDTASFLRNKGILKLEANRAGLWRGSLITRAAIKKFKSNYVSAGELARKLDTSPNRVLSLLASRNVTPVMGPSLDGCYQYLFRRSDIDGLGVDLVHLSTEARIRAMARDPRIRLTVDQIAHILQVSVQRVNRLIENGLLLPLRSRVHLSDGKVFNGYAVLRYMRLMGGRTDLISAPIAAKLLGVRIEYVSYFVRTGKLLPVTLKEKDRYRYFVRADVDHLIRLRQHKPSSHSRN